MTAFPSRSRAAALASVFGVALAVPWLAGWVPPDRIFELTGLVLAAMLVACLRVQALAVTNRAIMPPAFVIVFTSLMLFGPHVAVLIAAAAALTTDFVNGRIARGQILIDTAIAVFATQSAGLVYQSVGTGFDLLVWPALALPIAAAVVAYHVTQGVLANVVVPFLARRPVDRSWPKRALAGCPVYLLGACVAAALVVVIDRRMWDLAPVVAVALFLAYRTYADYVRRLEEQHRRHELIDHLEQGMSVLDRDGCVTLWNDALERMLHCSGERALGRPFLDAVPALARTELPRAIKETVADGRPGC